MKSKIQNPKSKIAIIGAGPAGASLAIRLARENFPVTLIERELFPRQKLCGEFISPECLRHFRDLDVSDEMLAAGGEPIRETVFYTPDGGKFTVPSEWFTGTAAGALSLSRAAMDFLLLKKAEESGVQVLEESSVVGLLTENGEMRGVKIRCKDGAAKDIAADIIVDATGRARVLGKLAEKEFDGVKKIQNPKPKIQNRLVGFKTHLANAAVPRNVCEIYFFRGGYGGLSLIENNLANHCFLVESAIVKEFGGAERIVKELIFQNPRARAALENAAPVFDWLAVSIDEFGIKNPSPAKNLFIVGDAAAFIDPFTGSGVLSALESAEILARAVCRNAGSVASAAETYERLHRENFRKRMRFCSLIRRAVAFPKITRWAMTALNQSRSARVLLARSTRRF